MTVALSFLVPTHREDRPLKRCLDSIYSQLGPRDEVIVVGDTTDGQLPGVERLVLGYGPRARYLTYAGIEHSWGHDQLQYGLTQAQGDYWHASDDDDIWTSEAVATIRRGVETGRDQVHLFRFRHYNGLVYWLTPGLVERDMIGGHCLVAPNHPDRIGKYGVQYNGDFDMIESTIALNGGVPNVVWHNQLIAVARP